MGENVILGKDVDVVKDATLTHVHTGDRGKVRNFTIMFGTEKQPLVIGSDFFIGTHCYLNGAGGLTIGSRVTVAHGAMIFSDSGPNTSPWLQEHFPITAAHIQIGDDVWVGAGAMILPGVTIGNRVVIGAGSLVKDDVPDNAVVAGTPARLIRTLA
jgi:maltose O-acetyltransferase